MVTILCQWVGFVVIEYYYTKYSKVSEIPFIYVESEDRILPQGCPMCTLDVGLFILSNFSFRAQLGLQCIPPTQTPDLSE